MLCLKARISIHLMHDNVGYRLTHNVSILHVIVLIPSPYTGVPDRGAGEKDTHALRGWRDGHLLHLSHKHVLF